MCVWGGVGWEERAEAEALPELDPQIETKGKKSQGLVFWSGDRLKGWGRGASIGMPGLGGCGPLESVPGQGRLLRCAPTKHRPHCSQEQKVIPFRRWLYGPWSMISDSSVWGGAAEPQALEGPLGPEPGGFHG